MVVGEMVVVAGMGEGREFGRWQNMDRVGGTGRRAARHPHPRSRPLPPSLPHQALERPLLRHARCTFNMVTPSPSAAANLALASSAARSAPVMRFMRAEMCA